VHGNGAVFFKLALKIFAKIRCKSKTNKVYHIGAGCHLLQIKTL